MVRSLAGTVGWCQRGWCEFETHGFAPLHQGPGLANPVAKFPPTRQPKVARAPGLATAHVQGHSLPPAQGISSTSLETGVRAGLHQGCCVETERRWSGSLRRRSTSRSPINSKRTPTQHYTTISTITSRMLNPALVMKHVLQLQIMRLGTR